MTQQTKCANCGETTTEKNIRPLYELPNLYARLDPGSEVPAGECRECGAFVYLVPPAEAECLECGHLKINHDEVCQGEVGCPCREQFPKQT